MKGNALHTWHSDNILGIIPNNRLNNASETELFNNLTVEIFQHIMPCQYSENFQLHLFEI